MRCDVHVERLPYGRGSVEVRIPRDNYLGTLAPRTMPGVADPTAEVVRALEHPIGTERLRDIAKGAGSAVVVINDVTRPTATHLLLPPLLDELRAAGVPGDHVTLLVATGTHRDTTAAELEAMLGADVLGGVAVVNHHCEDAGRMIRLGETSHGVPVAIHGLYYEADVKILTGSIGPHQTAGFTGGRKSVLPGIAGIDTLKHHHGVSLRSLTPAMGQVEGNKFHESALEGARMAGVDFILNTVQNHMREITHVVAGDVEQAWLAGVRVSRSIFEVEAPCAAEIVITSPGGFPKDLDLYQAQKSMAAAEKVVIDGGTIILPAECPDGIGARGFYEWMAAAATPQDVIDRFFHEGFSIGSSKAWLYARCLKRAEVILVTRGITDDILREMFTRRADSVDDALEMAFTRQGPAARVAVLKNAADVIPRVGTSSTATSGSSRERSERSVP